MGRPQLFLVVEGTLAQIWGLGLVQRAQLLPGPLHGPGQLRHSRGTQAIHRYCSSRSAMFSRNFSRVFFFSQEIIWLNSEKVINLDLIIMAIKCQSNQDRSVVLIWDQPEKMSAFFFDVWHPLHHVNSFLSANFEKLLTPHSVLNWS